MTLKEKIIDIPKVNLLQKTLKFINHLILIFNRINLSKKSVLKRLNHLINFYYIIFVNAQWLKNHWVKIKKNCYLEQIIHKITSLKQLNCLKIEIVLIKKKYIINVIGWRKLTIKKNH